MGYWTDRAELLDSQEDHPFYDLLRDALEVAKPSLFAELEAYGDLDAYLTVKVSDALAELDEHAESGLDYDVAKELVLDSLLPKDDEDPEDPTAGHEDAIAALSDWNAGKDPLKDVMNADPQRMALQVGATVTRNGTTYTLNENHRWTVKHPAPQQNAQKAAPPQQQPARPQAQQAGLQPSRPRVAPPPKQLNQQQSIASMAGQKPQTAPQSAPQHVGPGVGAHDPQVESDSNHDGVTDTARVGVGAFDVPPPPKKIRRIPGLAGMAKKAEDHFASAFEKNPDQYVGDAIILFTGSHDKTPTFETDACKRLSPYWASTELGNDLASRSKNRATLNTALHQTANAIAKNAFVQHLNTLPEGSEIFVTVGGCGAGKGYGLETDDKTGKPRVPEAAAFASRAAVVWDSAGDQNATENPWILQEARKRGLKVNYLYVHADPKVSWADPDRGVVQRATKQKDGRMVDAMVFADSYAIGAQNHHKFHQNHQNDPDVKFMFLKNNSGAPPDILPGVPQEALAINRNELASFAVESIKQRTDLPDHIMQGALAGTGIWSG